MVGVQWGWGLGLRYGGVGNGGRGGGDGWVWGCGWGVKIWFGGGGDGCGERVVEVGGVNLYILDQGFLKWSILTPPSRGRWVDACLGADRGSFQC